MIIKSFCSRSRGNFDKEACGIRKAPGQPDRQGQRPGQVRQGSPRRGTLRHAVHPEEGRGRAQQKRQVAGEFIPLSTTRLILSKILLKQFLNIILGILSKIPLERFFQKLLEMDSYNNSSKITSKTFTKNCSNPNSQLFIRINFHKNFEGHKMLCPLFSNFLRRIFSIF